MSWPRVILAEIALKEKAAIVSGPFGSNISKKFFVEEGVPVIRGNNLSIECIDFIDDGFVFLTEEKAAEFKNCEATADDLIFTAAGTLGQVGIIPRKTKFERYIISNKQMRARIDPMKAEPKFVFYWLKTQEMVGYIIQRNTGSSIPLINLTILRNLPIPLPPLTIQRKIVEILSAYDDLITLNQRRIQLLEESARLLYREWFVKLRFPGYKSVAVKDGVPEGWEREVLEALCNDIRDAIDPSEVEPDSPYLSMEHMPQRSLCLDTWDNAEKVQSTKLKFTDNDILFGKIRPYFHKVGLAFIKGITSTDVIVIRSKESRFLPIVAMTVSSDEFVSHAVATSNGTKMPRADWKVLRKWPVLVPPDELLMTFEGLIKPIFEQLQNLCFQNRVLKQARDLLLPKLMSGALDVSRIRLPDEVYNMNS